MQAAHNIGFAMDSPDGLIVPNIKNVQDLTVLEIASEMQRLMALGEQSRLGQSDITGGTFSLSNIGSVSFLYSLQSLCEFVSSAKTRAVIFSQKPL